MSSGIRGKRDADLSSEDEFEKEMDSEAMATLRLMVSPTAAAQAAKGHVARATPTASGSATDKPQTGRSSRALARARQRRSSTEQQRKTVRFSGDVKTEDVMEEGASTGLISIFDLIKKLSILLLVKGGGAKNHCDWTCWIHLAI